MTGSDATLPDVHTNLAAALHAAPPELYAARGEPVALHAGLLTHQEETADVAA